MNAFKIKTSADRTHKAHIATKTTDVVKKNRNFNTYSTQIKLELHCPLNNENRAAQSRLFQIMDGQ